MNDHIQKSKNQRWFLRIFSLIILFLLFLARIGYGQIQATEKQSVLQGSIVIHPAQSASTDPSGKIQPGTPIKVVVTVENKGQQASPPGQLFVRYAFAQPLDKQPSSIIFETEKKEIPSIQPGKKADIGFSTQHFIPSVLDFVRDDWSMREYQAVVSVNQEEKIIGSLAITFSAYYYPAIKKEFPTKISS